MNIKFKNKLILVTGSTQGIGFSIGKTLLNLGAKVIFNSRTKDIKQLQNLKKKSFEHMVADVTNPNEAMNLLGKIKKEFGLLDHIVCNVGNGSRKNMVPNSNEEFNNMITNNLSIIISIVIIIVIFIIIILVSLF